MPSDMDFLVEVLTPNALGVVRGLCVQQSNSIEKRMTMRKKLKLYVWEEVLTDYTSGAMFALATSTNEARSLILKKCDYVPSRDLALEPKCIEKPEGFVVWGGG